MGAKFATIALVALATVFTYQLLSSVNTVPIAKTTFSGTANLFKVMQGRG